MALGPAGNYVSGFPDDLAFEDWLARLDTLADAHQRLREGEQVSGPGAETYRHRVQAATRFAGRVLRTKRHATTMLANPDLQIFPGKGMTCVLDPKRAACRLRSEEDSTRRTPDLDDCRPNCVNIARTDRDIKHVLVQIERLRPLVDDPLAPPSDPPANSTSSTAWNASSPPTTAPDNPTMATDHEAERDAITAAIQRLLDGHPTRSTGALTTLQLSAEAGVKRWVLTHKHVDLKEEFVRRKSEANGIPPAYQHLHARAIDAEVAAQTLREDNDRLRERVAVYPQVIHGLRTELDRLTNNTQRSPVRTLPISAT